MLTGYDHIDNSRHSSSFSPFCNPVLILSFPKWFMTHSQFEFGEGGHVDDTDGLFAAFHFCSNYVKPVWLIKSLTLVQGQQIYREKQSNSTKSFHSLDKTALKSVKIICSPSTTASHWDKPFPGGTKYLGLSKPCFSIHRAPWVSRRSYRGLVLSWRPVWKSHRGTFSSYSRAEHWHTNIRRRDSRARIRIYCNPTPIGFIII